MTAAHILLFFWSGTITGGGGGSTSGNRGHLSPWVRQTTETPVRSPTSPAGTS